MKFCVPIVYKGLSNYVVEADTAEQARELAVAQFNNGEVTDLLGNEWESIEDVLDPEVVE
jgi:hypothetical protein